MIISVFKPNKNKKNVHLTLADIFYNFIIFLFRVVFFIAGFVTLMLSLAILISLSYSIINFASANIPIQYVLYKDILVGLMVVFSLSVGTSLVKNSIQNINY